MNLYRTNVALSIKGDRVEKGSEIELSDEDVARLDAADITALSAIPASEPEEKEEEIALEDMTSAQLKERAKELGLKASGSAADIRERITLHLAASEPEEKEEEITND